MPKRARFVQPFRQNSEEFGQPLSAREYPISYRRIESYRMVVSGGGCPRGGTNVRSPCLEESAARG